MEWRMVVITRQGDKADIRQIVGRDWAAWRKSASRFGTLVAALKSAALMP